MKIQANKSFFKSLKRIGSFGEKLRLCYRWCRYHLFNRDFKELHKTVMKSYPWDSDYLYELERAKINEMRKYHQKKQFFKEWEFVFRDMTLCMKLIDIFTEKIDLFAYDGELKFIPIEGSEDVEVKTDDLKYKCYVNVNMKNIDRFCKNEKEKEWINEHPHELYRLKAKYLYHKIRTEKDDCWWI